MSRVKATEIIEQLDAATLKTFRRRDEFEIRDIRRRLGLPIVNGTYMPELYYEKESLNGILFKDSFLIPSSFLSR